MLHDRYRFTTVRHVLEYYMENHGFGVPSWSDLANMTRVFIEVMGHRRLQDLTPDHFNAYCSGRKRGAWGKKKAKSTGTLRRELTHLQTAINFCAKAKLVNPEHAPYIPMPPRPAPRDRWLDKEEIARMKAAAEPWSRGDRFLRIVFDNGGRKTGIQELKWAQINFVNNLITYLPPGERQTKKKKPTVPMSSGLREYLLELRKREPDATHVLGRTNDIRDALEAVSKRAKVEGVTPHVLRHTWASHAVMNGTPIEEVARILGDTIVTTEKTYAKFKPDYLKSSIERAAL